MVSSKQRSANQRNASRSTGPRSEEGKRAASLNAMRHGLSSQTALDSLNPKLEQVCQIILGEISDALLARTIAARVLDYERTEAYQLEVAAKEAQGRDGFIDEDALAKTRREGEVTAFLGGQVEVELQKKGLSKPRKEELKVYKESLEFLTRVAVHTEQAAIRGGRDEAMRLKRYFKRASNQLIKAVKAASLGGSV